MSATTREILGVLVPLAGAGQLALCAASTAIPRVLGWRAALAPLAPLPRQLFWTYATYVAGAHVFFGLVTLLLADVLLAGDPLARALTGFIALWWGVRLALAFLGVERRALPDTPAIRWAHRALLLLFVGLTGVYAALALGLGSA